MTNTKKLIHIFIVPKGIGKNIVYSQMIPMVNKLNQLDIKTRIAVHLSDENKFIGIDNVILYSKLSEITIIHDIQSFYIRSVFDFIKLYSIKIFYKKSYLLLFDFRGLIAEESYLRNKSFLRYFVLKKIEEFVYKKADYLNTVSYQFKHYLVSNFGPKIIKVIPCCTNFNKIKIYEEKNIIKFVYVGGMSEWQKFNNILNIYKKISENIPNTSLTIITLDKELAEKSMQGNNIKGAEVKSMDQNEVINDLINYDFGFLLRDDILLNNVASPIKFIEYISQGVIPIISKGIGDYSELVEKNNLGLIIDINNDILDIERINELINDKEIYKRLFEISNNFLWEKNINIDFFNDLSKKDSNN